MKSLSVGFCTHKLILVMVHTVVIPRFSISVYIQYAQFSSILKGYFQLLNINNLFLSLSHRAGSYHLLFKHHNTLLSLRNVLSCVTRHLLPRHGSLFLSLSLPSSNFTCLCCGCPPGGTEKGH